MIGRKITTQPSMISSVSLLEEASHTVRLMSGLLDDGSRNGNSDSPAVAIVPSGTSAEADPGQQRTLARQHREQRAQISHQRRQPEQRMQRVIVPPAAGDARHRLHQRIGGAVGASALVMR